MKLILYVEFSSKLDPFQNKPFHFLFEMIFEHKL